MAYLTPTANTGEKKVTIELPSDKPSFSVDSHYDNTIKRRKL